MAARIPPTLQHRPFYGWSIAAVAGLAMLAGTAMGPTAFSVFIQPMSDDLGWSRTLISGALSLGTLAGAAAAPLAGMLVDRYGARVMLTAAGLGLGVAMVGVALSQSPLAFYVFYGLGRMLDMGVILVGSTAAVANWFIRRRGRAMGLAMMGEAIGLIAIVPLAQLIILSYGWRSAWLVLAAGVTLSLAPAAALLVRRRPEDMGLLPDGDRPSPGGRARGRRGDGARESGEPLAASPHRPDPSSHTVPSSHSEEVHFTLGQAVRTASFWLLIASVSLAYLAMAGISTHQIPVLVEQGLSPVLAAGLVGLHAAAWAAGSPLWGLAAERLPARYGLGLVYLLAALSVVLLLNVQGLGLGVAYALLYGLVLAGQQTVEPVAWANYYGRFSLGAIRGFSRPFVLAANALGTLLAGVAYDLTGGYGTILVAFGAIFCVGAALMLFARPPQVQALVPRPGSL